MSEQRDPIGVAMIGYGFMGAMHSQAWRTAHHFFELPATPRMVTVVGRDAGAVADAATRYGWESSATDWRAVLERPDVDIVDICTPGDTHAPIAIAALQAGKHVLCEKPLANTVADAQAMVEAAAEAAARGVRSMVGFTYRCVPAIELARELVAEGRLGELRHVRAHYLQDWLTDAETPLSWRLDKDKAGSGALGDIGAHIIDLTQYLTAQRIETVTAMMNTFVDERPVPASTHGLSAVAGSGRGPVTVDDAALFLARFDGGAVGTFEATRFAAGRKNAIRIELNGSRGSLAFDFEDMNVLHVHDHSEPARTAGFRRIVVTEPDHPYAAAWWPPGHGLGYEHGFTHQVVNLLRAIGDGRDPEPSFATGLDIQRVLAAVERSSDHGTWESVDR